MKFLSVLKGIRSSNPTDELNQDETLAKKLVKKSFGLYFFTYLGAPAGYLTRIIVSNSLGVEDVGVLYAIVSFVGILAVYNDLGMTESLRYFLPKFWIAKKYDEAKTSVFLSLFVQLAISLLIILFLFFGAEWFGNNYFNSPEAVNILKLFCFYFLGLNFFKLLQNLFVSFQDTFNFQFINFVKLWSITIFSLVFFLLGRVELFYFALAWILGVGIALLLGFLLSKGKYKDIFRKGKFVVEKGFLKKYMSYAFRVFLGTNATLLLGQIDQQMVIYFLGPKDSGYFANYLSLFGMYTLVIGPIFGLLFPLFTELVTKKDTKKISLLQNFLYNNFIVFALILGMFFVVLGPEIAVLLFGEKFLPSGNLLSLHGGFVFLSVIIGINFAILAAYGKVKDRVKIVALTGVMNVIMDYFFIKFRGVYGVVVATIIDSFIMAGLSFLIVNKLQKIKLDWKFVLKNLVLVVVYSVLIFLGKDVIFNLFGDSRFVLLGFLFVSLLVFAGIVGGLNYKRVGLLVKEVRSFIN